MMEGGRRLKKGQEGVRRRSNVGCRWGGMGVEGTGGKGWEGKV